MSQRDSEAVAIHKGLQMPERIRFSTSPAFMVKWMGVSENTHCPIMHFGANC